MDRALQNHNISHTEFLENQIIQNESQQKTWYNQTQNYAKQNLDHVPLYHISIIFDGDEIIITISYHLKFI